MSESAASTSKPRCSVPVVDVPYDALQKDLGTTALCQKLRVENGTALRDYEEKHDAWGSMLQKQEATRCTSSRATGVKLDKDEEDKRRMAEVVKHVFSCVHLQAIPDPAAPGKGVVYNPFSQEAVSLASPTHPDIRPLFDVRKCVSRCGAVTRSSSRSESC